MLEMRKNKFDQTLRSYRSLTVESSGWSLNSFDFLRREVKEENDVQQIDTH